MEPSRGSGSTAVVALITNDDNIYVVRTISPYFFLKISLFES
jgi:hypothetical protein